MEKKERIKKKIENLLDVPLKAIKGDENENIEKKLGFFLVDKEYIRGVEERSEDWGFVYYSTTRNIAISKKEMPHNKWEYCIFKMGFNKEAQENLFPSPGMETKKYRFLHEANHAYQDYLCFNESPKEPEAWYEKVLEGEIESCYGRLFKFCFQKRMQEDEKEGAKGERKRGLSVWGNSSNYNHEENENIPNKFSEIAVRAQEDANELVTMYLWHPIYFDMYLDALSLNHNKEKIRERELTEEDLNKDGLARIKNDEVNYLKKLITDYVQEMKENIEKEES